MAKKCHFQYFQCRQKNVKKMSGGPEKNPKKCQKNVPENKKNILKTFFGHFWDRKWVPARTARNRKTPRPIFDDKKCPKNVFKMFFYSPGHFFDIFLEFFLARRTFF